MTRRNKADTNTSEVRLPQEGNYVRLNKYIKFLEYLFNRTILIINIHGSPTLHLSYVQKHLVNIWSTREYACANIYIYLQFYSSAWSDPRTAVCVIRPYITFPLASWSLPIYALRYYIPYTHKHHYIQHIDKCTINLYQLLIPQIFSRYLTSCILLLFLPKSDNSKGALLPWYTWAAHVISTVSASQYLRHSICITVSASQYLRYSICGTVSAAQYLRHSICITVSEVQYLRHSICGKMSAAQYLQHSICSTVSAAQYLWKSICSTVSVEKYLQHSICGTVSAAI